jgi:hypothetical protein
MSAKLSLTINGKRHELDAKEARRVFDELAAFLGEGKFVVVSAPAPSPQIVIHEHHQVPVPTLPPSFPWPNGPTCGDRPYIH